MINIFLKTNDHFEQVAEVIFRTLGINNFLEGDSQNVLSGVYSSYSVFGISIRLELNSYDYEDEYKFMLQIKKDLVTPFKIDSTIENMVAEIILKLLCNNFNEPIAIEKNNELMTVSIDNIFEMTH